jgi:hypothetical protein
VAARSKASVCDRSLAGIVGSHSAVGMLSLPCECSVLSGRSLCVGLIIPTDCGVSVYDREASIMRKPWPSRGSSAIRKKFNLL